MRFWSEYVVHKWLGTAKPRPRFPCLVGKISIPYSLTCPRNLSSSDCTFGTQHCWFQSVSRIPVTKVLHSASQPGTQRWDLSNPLPERESQHSCRNSFCWIVFICIYHMGIPCHFEYIYIHIYTIRLIIYSIAGIIALALYWVRICFSAGTARDQVYWQQRNAQLYHLLY